MIQSNDETSPSCEAEMALADLLEIVSRQLAAGEEVDLPSLCREHPEHADELTKLLPTIQQMACLGSQSQRLASGPCEPGAPDGDVTAIGTLGDYEILGEVGRGGMGVVYRARQKMLGRDVAIKVLPMAALADRHQLARFHNEVRATAALHHPHIVPIHTVGVERGIHYYAMQYIDGPTLAQMIRRLKTEDSDREGEAGGGEPAPPNAEHDTRRDLQDSVATERSQLMAAYCRTVALWGRQAAQALTHAHENGVVHRDIKPGNLFLDESGSIWVADFGLARLDSGSSMTRTGDVVGTLPYMAPEQALGKHAAVDHRADVYSLGATLYELLTLQPPYQGDDRQELLNGIAFQEPRSLRKVNAAIPRELETITLKAMEKAPADRTETAQELADDLQRFLDNRPILAKPPSPAQRITKYARRHWGVVATATALSLMLMMGAMLSTFMLWKANRTTEQALAESKAALDFLINDMLDAATPEVHQGRELTVQQALENAEKKIDTKFDNQPLTEAAVRHMMGDTYEALGEYSQAERHFSRAAQLREALLGRAHPDTLTSLSDLGWVYHRQGQYQAAANLHGVLLELSRRTLGSDHPQAIASLRRYAISVGQLPGRDEEALELHREALTLARRVHGTKDEVTVKCIIDLGGALAKTGAGKAEAHQLLEEGLALSRQLHGDQHTLTLNFMGNLAVLLMWERKHGEALKLLEETLEIQRTIYGEDHPQTLVSSLNLSALLNGQGKLRKSVELLERTLPQFRDVFGVDHRNTVYATKNLGNAYRDLGHRKEAQRVYEQGAAACRESSEYGPDAAMTLTLTLHAAMYDERRLQEALELVEKSHQRIQEMSASSQRNDLLRRRADSYFGLATLFRSIGRTELAETLYRRSVGILSGLLAEENDSDSRYDSALFGADLSTLLTEWNRENEALSELRRGRDIMQELLVEFPKHVRVRLRLARICMLEFKLTGDPELRREGCDLVRDLLDETPEYQGAQELLGEFYLEGMLDAKVGTPGSGLQQAIKIFEKLYQKAPGSLESGTQLGLAHLEYADELRRVGDTAQAAASYERSNSVLKSVLQIEPNYLKARRTLGRCLLQYGELCDDQNQRDQATVQYEALLDLAHTDGVIFFLVSIAQVHLGQVSDARTTFENGLAWMEEHNRAHNETVRLRDRAGEHLKQLEQHRSPSA